MVRAKRRIRPAVKPKAKRKWMPASRVVGLIAVFVVAGIAIVALSSLQPWEPTPLVVAPDTGEKTVGEILTFQDTGLEIETVDGKPVVRLFSSTSCPHCRWISGTFDKVAREYMEEGKIVAYHWEITNKDVADNTLTAENEGAFPGAELKVFQKFNPGGTVPTFVFGGRYGRVGNGYEAIPGDYQNPASEESLQHLMQEEAEFRGVIEALLEELAEKE